MSIVLSSLLWTWPRATGTHSADDGKCPLPPALFFLCFLFALLLSVLGFNCGTGKRDLKTLQ